MNGRRTYIFMDGKKNKDKKKFFKMSYEKRKSLYGYGFISLWLIGMIVFFLIPVVVSFIYSFMNVNPQKGGMSGEWTGMYNYSAAFSKDQYYRKYLVEVLFDALKTTPLIITFSLFIAVILNQKFKGRAFARAVFFLPVIVASGPVYSVITGDMSTSGAEGAEQFSTMFRTDMVTDILNFTGIYGLSDSMTSFIQSALDNIFALVWRSGIQILLFLAALQNIHPSVREAAQIEGATSWEFFWKITFPYVSPVVVANLVFTIIDSFTDSENLVMKRVTALRSDWNYGLASAMVWSYFFIVMAVVGLVLLIVNRYVYYEND